MQMQHVATRGSKVSHFIHPKHRRRRNKVRGSVPLGPAGCSRLAASRPDRPTTGKSARLQTHFDGRRGPLELWQCSGAVQRAGKYEKGVTVCCVSERGGGHVAGCLCSVLAGCHPGARLGAYQGGVSERRVLPGPRNREGEAMKDVVLSQQPLHHARATRRMPAANWATRCRACGRAGTVSPQTHRATEGRPRASGSQRQPRGRGATDQGSGMQTAEHPASRRRQRSPGARCGGGGVARPLIQKLKSQLANKRGPAPRTPPTQSRVLAVSRSSRWRVWGPGCVAPQWRGCGARADGAAADLVPAGCVSRGWAWALEMEPSGGTKKCSRALSPGDVRAPTLLAPCFACWNGLSTPRAPRRTPAPHQPHHRVAPHSQAQRDPSPRTPRACAGPGSCRWWLGARRAGALGARCGGAASASCAARSHPPRRLALARLRLRRPLPSGLRLPDGLLPTRSPRDPSRTVRFTSSASDLDERAGG